MTSSSSHRRTPPPLKPQITAWYARKHFSTCRPADHILTFHCLPTTAAFFEICTSTGAARLTASRGRLSPGQDSGAGPRVPLLTSSPTFPPSASVSACLLAPAAQKDRLSGKLSEEMDASPPSSCLPLSLAWAVGRSSCVHGFDGLTEVQWRRQWHWRRLLPLDARACAPARDGRSVRAGTKLGWNSFTRL